MHTIGHRLNALAADHGSNPALIFDDRAAVVRRARRRRAARRRRRSPRSGVSKGTRVGILMPNDPTCCAAPSAPGGWAPSWCPINTLFRSAELAYALRHADVGVLFMVSRFLRNHYLRMLVELCPELAHSSRPLRADALPCLRHVICQGYDMPRGAHRLGGLPRQRRAGLDAVERRLARRRRADRRRRDLLHLRQHRGAEGRRAHARQHAAGGRQRRRPPRPDAPRIAPTVPAVLLQRRPGRRRARDAVARRRRVAAGGVRRRRDAAPARARIAARRSSPGRIRPRRCSRHPEFDRDALHIRKGPGANAKWAAALFRPTTRRSAPGA